MEPALVGAVSGLIVAGCAAAGFWLAIGGRIAKAETSAENALRAAADAENEAKEARVAASSIAGQLSMYRENVIREFVLTETLEKVEQRLIASQEKSEERLTDAIDGMSKRLDRLIETRGGTAVDS